MEKLNKTRYLVTGAAGFVGANLIYALEKLDDVNVIAVVRSKSHAWRLKNITSKVKIVECDLTNYQDVEHLIATYKPTHIVHLAVKGVYQNQWSDPAGVLKTNYSVDVNLLEVLKKEHNFLSSIIIFGSIYEYGVQPGSMKEDQVVDINLNNLYAVSKRISVILSSSYNNILPIVTLRPSTIYGPYNDPTKFIEGTITKFLSSNPINVAKDVVKDFIYIDDVIDAIIAASNNAQHIHGEAINLGSGQGYSLEEVAAQIKEIMGISSKNNQIIVKADFRRENEAGCWLNSEKASIVLGWEPSTSIKDGIIKTIDWYRNNQDILPKATG